jgi:tetratricopeptide (TPR) repeat protein
MLIVLDNARDAGQVRPLLPGSPACVAVVTSRSRLVGLVATEGACTLTLDVLTKAEARELLAGRLGRRRVEDEPRLADEVIELCARLPLALSIAAASAATRPGLRLAALTAELRDAAGRLDALDAGDVTTDMRAVFSWSYGSLTASAKRMFRLLGIHPGPDIAVRAAASLAAIPPDQAQGLLDELAAAHLIAEHVPGRYACHDLLRTYAAEQAGAVDSEARRRAATHRMLDHYLHTACAADLRLSPSRKPLPLEPPQAGVTMHDLADRAQALAWLRAEHEGLLAVISHAADCGFESHAWQIPWCLGSYFDQTAHWQDWAAAQRVGDQSGEANASHYLGFACIRLGSYADSLGHLRHAVDLFRQLGDRLGEARTHSTIALACRREGQLAVALDHGRQALHLHRELSYQPGQAEALNEICLYEAHLGHHRKALTCGEQAVRIFRELGNQAGEAAAWDSLGEVRHLIGHHAEAIACYQRANDMFRRLDNAYYEAVTLMNIAETQSAVGDLRAARTSWQQALAILDDLHHPDADQVRAKLQDLAAPGGLAPAATGRSPSGG